MTVTTKTAFLPSAIVGLLVPLCPCGAMVRRASLGGYQWLEAWRESSTRIFRCQHGVAAGVTGPQCVILNVPLIEAAECFLGVRGEASPQAQKTEARCRRAAKPWQTHYPRQLVGSPLQANCLSNVTVFVVRHCLRSASEAPDVRGRPFQNAIKHMLLQEAARRNPLRSPSVRPAQLMQYLV